LDEAVLLYSMILPARRREQQPVLKEDSMLRNKRLGGLAAGTAILVVMALTCGTGLAKDIETRMIPESFSALAEKAKPGVVNISTVKTIAGGRGFRPFHGSPFDRQDPFWEFFGPFMQRGPQQDFKQRSQGTGFIVDRDGFIVTNNHVVENADKIKVKLADGQEFDAEPVGRDPNTDLALIRIKGAKNITPLEMGDSDSLKVGSWVVAIGSPFGLEQTVTAGIVSAKGRVIGSGPYDDFIQTDASINPGNSGGPLFNMSGEVVGINTAIIASGQGIGFAIPVNLAKGIIAQLKSSGEVTRGWLGVGIQDLTPELAEYYKINRDKGVLVTEVYPGDPADKAGVKPKDVIVAVEGKPVSSGRELSRTIAELPVGKQAAISLLRDGQEKTIQVKLGKRSEEVERHALRSSPKAEKGEEMGVRFAELTPEIAEQAGLPEDEKGVVVMDVAAGSKAEQAGLRTGDLVKEINRQTVVKLDDLRSQLAKIKDGDAVHLLIRRGGGGFLVIKLTK
jgi:serine protease Do